MNRDDSKIRIEVVNWEPADYSGKDCAEICRTTERVIPLGSQFDSGVGGDVDVNDTTATFAVS